MACKANWSLAMPRSVRPDIEPGTIGSLMPNSSSSAASIAALPAPPVETSVPSMSKRQARNREETPALRRMAIYKLHHSHLLLLLHQPLPQPRRSLAAFALLQLEHLDGAH